MAPLTKQISHEDLLMFVVDVLRYEVENVPSIVKLLNNEGCRLAQILEPGLHWRGRYLGIERVNSASNDASVEGRCMQPPVNCGFPKRSFTNM